MQPVQWIAIFSNNSCKKLVAKNLLSEQICEIYISKKYQTKAEPRQSLPTVVKPKTPNAKAAEIHEICSVHTLLLCFFVFFLFKVYSKANIQTKIFYILFLCFIVTLCSLCSNVREISSSNFATTRCTRL